MVEKGRGTVDILDHGHPSARRCLPVAGARAACRVPGLCATGGLGAALWPCNGQAACSRALVLQAWVESGMAQR